MDCFVPQVWNARCCCCVAEVFCFVFLFGEGWGEGSALTQFQFPGGSAVEEEDKGCKGSAWSPKSDLGLIKECQQKLSQEMFVL